MALGSQFHKWVQADQQPAIAALHQCKQQCPVQGNGEGGGAFTFKLILHRCRRRGREGITSEFLGWNILILPVYRAVLWADVALSPPGTEFSGGPH